MDYHKFGISASDQTKLGDEIFYIYQSIAYPLHYR